MARILLLPFVSVLLCATAFGQDRDQRDRRFGTPQDVTLLDSAIRIILEHHVYAPAPQELAAKALRAYNPEEAIHNPASLRKAWKIQNPDEITDLLKGQRPPVARRAFDQMGFYQNKTLADFANGLPGIELAQFKAPQTDPKARTYVGFGITLPNLRWKGAFAPGIGTLIPDGPADRAGLKAGDVFLAIDGISLVGKESRAAVDLIRARHGTEAQMKIGRMVGGRHTELDITVIRDVVEFGHASVSRNSYEGSRIWIGALIDSTIEELREREREMARNDDPIRLDLTGLTHCEPRHAIQLADALLPKAGMPMGKAVTLQGSRQLRSTGLAVFADRKVIIELDRSSAPALGWVAQVASTANRETKGWQFEFHEPSLASEVFELPVAKQRFAVQTMMNALRVPTTHLVPPPGAAFERKIYSPRQTTRTNPSSLEGPRKTLSKQLSEISGNRELSVELRKDRIKEVIEQYKKDYDSRVYGNEPAAKADDSPPKDSVKRQPESP